MGYDERQLHVDGDLSTFQLHLINRVSNRFFCRRPVVVKVSVVSGFSCAWHARK